jgi:uncharacterized membrane protein
VTARLYELAALFVAVATVGAVLAWEGAGELKVGALVAIFGALLLVASMKRRSGA